MTKTSLSIDREKAAAAAEILGTSTLTATIDAALSEVLRRESARRLLERIRRDGGIGPGDEELRRLRTP
jgi:Arc/MetJ family transcription regulator